MSQFAYPWLFLLLPLPLLIRHFFPVLKGLHGDALRVPFINDLEKISIKSGSLWRVSSAGTDDTFSRFLALLWVVWFMLICAVARPQLLGEPVRLESESRDIMLVLDISTSMLTKDFSLNNRRIDRLSAVKKTAEDFIKKRANDRIGLVLFGTRAYLQAPLTFDKGAVSEILWSMQAGMAGDSTSIGDALGLALKSLQNNKDTANKVIILLTDGESNDGSIALPQAIKLAEDEGIKTYTIGVGSENRFFGALFGQSRGVDERGLKAIADATSGQYFRAENTASLQRIYQMIDALEPSDNADRFVREVQELYYIPLLAAILAAVVLAIALRRAE